MSERQLMSDLDEALGQQEDRITDAHTPKGWEPYTEYTDSIGEAVVRLPNPTDSERDLLITAGFDPDSWRIDGPIRTSKWMKQSGDWLYAFRFKVIAGESEEVVQEHIDDLVAKIRTPQQKYSVPHVGPQDDAFVFFASDWQVGKALRDDTPILTADGWKKHGEIRPDDLVYGPDGTLKRVLATTGSSLQECYLVEFDQGEPIVASKDHLWGGWRRYKTDDGVYSRRRMTVTTEWLASLRESARDGRSYQSRPFHLDLNQPLQFPEAELPIDPYTLGAWLGDGTSRNCYQTVGAEDVEYWSVHGTYIPSTTPTGTKTLRRDGLTTALRSLGLLRNKHIPEQYLTASVEQRVALLQGLMDTDGSVSLNGSCEFTQVNTRTAEGFMDLLSSLGIKYHHTIKKTTHQDAHRIRFTPSIQVFRMERKAKHVRLARDDQASYRYIRRVTPVGEFSAQCLTVEDHLYLVGKDMVVTHNCEGSIGTDTTVDRVLEGIDKTVDRIKELRSLGRSLSEGAFIGMGDIVEGCIGNYPGQQFLVDRNRRDQNKIARELICYGIDQIAPHFQKFTVACVHGNHGEHRADGKKATDDADNDDTACFEAVKEVYDRTGHDFNWIIPDDEMSIALTLGGVKAGITHGHIFRKGATAQQKQLEWFRGQDFGFQPVRGAQILFSAHFHHYLCTEVGSRTMFQCPAADPGSKWFRDSSGEDAPPGFLTLRLSSEEQMGYSDVQILRPSK